MRIGIPVETQAGERRVALIPESVGRLVKKGHEVGVQQGAGLGANFSDDLYTAAGAVVVDSAAELYRHAEVVVKVSRPSADEVTVMAPGTALVAMLQPGASGELFQQMAAHRVNAFSLELVPRITRAQVMDVLSSQATVAGYKAVLLGASELSKMMPMLTTAAGTLAPARTFVIGAGVAGLQAIATARRLGAVVSGFDIRPAAREQVLSLGAMFVAAEVVTQEAETAGGYARAQSEDEAQRTLAAIGAHIPTQDLVITTAQIPNRRAPLLITREMVESMRPGSVIVDLASESGGNCALTRAGESVVHNGVVVMGPLNLPGSVPLHASQMFSKNVEAFLGHIATKEGALHLDLEDEVTGPMCVVYNGEVRMGRSAA
jgi:H+-translocating NAD(P) transhydrogenase subunit alpha